MNTELFQQEGYEFMASAFEVYNEMGNGYTEEVYQESLERELGERKIPFSAQSELPIYYKGVPLRRKFRPDLMIRETILVELKAVSTLTPEHEAQVLNYMKASGKTVGYLVNYGSRDRLQWKRFVRTPKLAEISAN
ncbi:MAG: hypothetical protein JWM32_899 [Verrucomicrobia bacterium]|nr:hypothetical protein [Verrucomicrobiota bacterium]